jgi:hypothetical protein
MRTDIDVRTPAGLRITGIATGPGTPDTPLLVCLPGGSYTARYFDVPGFSLLDVAEANGFTAIALDPATAAAIPSPPTSGRSPATPRSSTRPSPPCGPNTGPTTGELWLSPIPSARRSRSTSPRPSRHGHYSGSRCTG